MQVVVAQGLSGAEDAAVLFPTNNGRLQVPGVSFNTRDISTDTAHALVQELTSFVRQPSSQRLGPGPTITLYTMPG